MKATALAGLLVVALAFLDSQTWKDMKKDIVAFMPKLKTFYTDTLKPFFKNVGKFLLDPTWKNFTSLFAGVEDKRSLAFGLAGLTALFLADDVITGMAAGGALFVAMTGLSALFGKNGLFRRRITGLTDQARNAAGGGRGSPRIGRLARFGGIAAAAIGALNAARILSNDEMPREQKNSELYGVAYGTTGAILGGVLGSFLGPVGTVIGGGIGFTLGQKLGTLVAEKVNEGGFFSDKTFSKAFDDARKKIQSALLFTFVSDDMKAAMARMKEKKPFEVALENRLNLALIILGNLPGLNSIQGPAFDNALTNLKIVGGEFISMTERLKDWVSGLSTSFKEKVSDFIQKFKKVKGSNSTSGLSTVGRRTTREENEALRKTLGVGDKIADPNPLKLGGRTDEISNRALDNARQTAISLGMSPAIVNASNSSINASSLNVTNTSTPMFHPSPLLGAVIASI